MSSFTEIPVLDYSLSLDEATKSTFLDELRHVLLDVGFCYIKNTGIDEALQDEVVRLAKAFFDLPESEKLRIEMKNSPHFLGYSRLGNEITAKHADCREQLDLATEFAAPSPKEPRYRNLRGPNQWPDETLIPGFRKAYSTYIAAMTTLSTDFLSLIAQAIGLPKESFEKYFEGVGESESGTERQDKIKLVKYPDLAELGTEGGQGVGPHKDSMLSSYLLQATDHHGLQVQNSRGGWVDCPQIPGTFVVAMGQGLEAMTGGVCVATTHRVLSPVAGSGPRFSIPFFQGVSYDATFESMEVPDEVRALKKTLVGHAEVEMTFKKEKFKRLGEATLMNRIQSHPDVGAKYYPDLLALQRVQAAAINEAAAVKRAETLLVVPGPTNTPSSDDTPEGASSDPPKMRRRAPTIIVEKVSTDTAYGEDPGPDGSIERKEAWKMRQADAVPDVVRVIDSEESERVEVGLGLKGKIGGLAP